MADIIPFPFKDERALKKALENAQALYSKAGLSQQGADAAIAELGPVLSPLLKSHEIIFELSAEAGLTTEQVNLVTEAHNKCVQAAIAHFTEQLGLAVATIAGIVGSKYE